MAIKYTAFWNGQVIRDVTLQNIMAMAKRGLITEAGKALMLVPDTRHGPADARGYKAMKRVKKADCIPLYALCPLGKRQPVTEGSKKVALKPSNDGASSDA